MCCPYCAFIGGLHDGCLLRVSQVFHNQLGSNERGSLLDGYLPEPSGMVCLNAVDKDAPDTLAQECPRNVRSKSATHA